MKQSKRNKVYWLLGHQIFTNVNNYNVDVRY